MIRISTEDIKQITLYKIETSFIVHVTDNILNRRKSLAFKENIDNSSESDPFRGS